MTPADPSLTAIHEAGHVIARFEAASVMSREPVACVSAVEMREGVYGTTSGPFFSAEIVKHEKETIARLFELDPAQILSQGRGAIIQTARTAGVDIAAWADAKILEMIGGAAAEAKARRAVIINEVLDKPECDDDRAEIFGIARLAGFTEQQRLEAIGRATTRLRQLWSDERKWNALLALARALPKTGSLDGAKCWEIYSQALGAEATPKST